MNEQGKRVQKRRQEDAAFNRMLLWLAGAVVFELLSLLVRKLYINFSLTDLGLAVASGLNAFFSVFQYAGLVLTIAGFVWLAAACRKQKKQTLPLICAIAVLWLWAAAVLCYRFGSTGAGVLCVLPAVGAALAAVFFLYQREFFCNVVLGGIGIAALCVFRSIYMMHPRMTYCGFALVWVVLALAAFAAFRLSKNDGKLGALQLLPSGVGYLPVYLTCAVTAAALLAALILGVSAAYYIMAVLVAWLFCLAVYYTVKLM